MTLTCTHCGRENNVAGWYEAMSRVEGKSDPSVYCGYCGKKFLPKSERKEEKDVETKDASR